MYKYALLNRFLYYRRLQVYMYNFICVEPEKMIEVYYFPYAKSFVSNYKIKSTPGPSPIIGLYLVTFVQNIMN